MERLNFKELSCLEGKEWYQMKMVNRFGALENMVANVDIMRLCKCTSTGVVKLFHFHNTKRNFTFSMYHHLSPPPPPPPNKKLKVEPCNFIVNQPCIQYAMGSVYCLLYVWLNISTVVMEPNVLAGY